VFMCLRRWIPESPRWLMIHGRNSEAEQIVAEVEKQIGVPKWSNGVEEYWSNEQARKLADLPITPRLQHSNTSIVIRTRTHTPWHEIWDAIVHEHRRRSFLGFVLMLTQAFFYNAIFFTYALVLMRFYSVPEQNVGSYLLPFALGNALG